MATLEINIYPIEDILPEEAYGCSVTITTRSGEKYHLELRPAAHRTPNNIPNIDNSFSHNPCGPFAQVTEEIMTSQHNTEKSVYKPATGCQVYTGIIQLD